MNNQIAGQLFRVGLLGRRDSTLTSVEVITIGNTANDVLTRLPYVIDLADFDSYKISFVVKLARGHVIRWHTLQKAEIERPDGVIARDYGTDDVWQPVQKSSSRKRWDVTARSRLFADNEKHALRKLAERLNGDSTSVETIVTEIPEPSGFAMPSDQSVFLRASFVRG